jgi:hypothetical protein
VTRRGRLAGLVLLTLAAAAAGFAFVPPVPQWPEYHDFADRRAWLGLRNGLDVASNALFTLVGLAGLQRLLATRRRPVLLDPRERWPWLVFFLALVLLGPASAYYHLAPDNARLFWDRQAMSAVFMAWLAVQLAERVGPRAGVLALPALLATGAGAALYWILSEAAGAGDLRAWGLVHFYPMLLIPLLLGLFPARYTRAGDVLAVLGLYGLALAAEWLDRPLFELTGLISGHTLKHLLAALAAAWALRMLVARRAIASFEQKERAA